MNSLPKGFTNYDNTKRNLETGLEMIRVLQRNS